MAARHVLLALWASTAHAWTARCPPLTRPLRATCSQLQADSSGAATGEDVEKTDGIPNYMIRTSGTVSRVADGKGVWDSDHIVSILTSDVIDMVQQQGGAAQKITCLGEDILVEGLLFDDFKADDTFEIALPDDTANLTIEIIEPRAPSALDFDQLGDDDDTKRGIASILSLGPGFSGWSARVVVPGQVEPGCEIAKQQQQQPPAEP